MRKLFILCLILVAALSGAVYSLTVKASPSGSWLNTDLVTKKSGITSTLPTTLNGGNIDCAKIDNSICSVPTTFGSAGGGGVRFNGSGDYIPLLSYLENQPKVMAVPNSSELVSFISSPAFGFYLYFNQRISVRDTTADIGGLTRKAYQLEVPPDGVFADKSGHRLRADIGSINYSANGQWMIVTVPGVAFARVNLQTYEVLPFGYPITYGNGLSPAPKTAISNDGRFAAVDSKELGSFKLYDLNTCTEVPDSIYGPVACQSRDMESTIQKQLPGFEFIYKARFLSDDLLEIYTKNLESDKPAIARYLISNTNIDTQVDYLTLGDSYISGEGAFNYQAGTDTNKNHCHLSYNSYPFLIGAKLNYSSYQSVACSGAVTADIIHTTLPDSVKKAQSDGKDEENFNSEIYTNFLPGYRAQINFVSRYQPKVVTLSVGGNDMGFSKILLRCMEADSCYSDYEDRLELVREINNIVYPGLIDAYTNLKNAGPTDMLIYIIGYPQIAKPEGDCANNVRLNSDEVKFSQQIISYLDSAIKAAADKVGVKYVDVQDAFDGHRLCETNFVDSAMNGITAGGDRPFSFGPIGAESYHPTKLGYELLENKILAATNNLTSAMPLPDTSAMLPTEDNLTILDAPKSGRQINSVNYDDSITNDVQYRGGAWNITYKSGRFLLKAGSKVAAFLFSDPISLGEYTTNQQGKLDIEIPAPKDLPVGFHTLHLYGTDIAGQPVDIQKIIYVADTPEDYDGDGIDNDSDSCLVVEPSGEDYDQDGIDDACDGTISQPPSKPVAESEPEKSSGTFDTKNIEAGAHTSTSNVQKNNPPASATNDIELLQGASTISSGTNDQPESAVLGLSTGDNQTPGYQTADVSTSESAKLILDWRITSSLLLAAVVATFALWRRIVVVNG